MIAPNLKGRAAYAWAAVAKKDGKILRNGRGHYGIYTHRKDAVDDCPMYGQVRRVRITLAPILRGEVEEQQMIELTRWYPPGTKPVRTGWYECRCCNNRYFWSGSWDNTDIGGPSLKQDIEWRGLTKRHHTTQEKP